MPEIKFNPAAARGEVMPTSITSLPLGSHARAVAQFQHLCPELTVAEAHHLAGVAVAQKIVANSLAEHKAIVLEELPKLRVPAVVAPVSDPGAWDEPGDTWPLEGATTGHIGSRAELQAAGDVADLPPIAVKATFDAAEEDGEVARALGAALDANAIKLDEEPTEENTAPAAALPAGTPRSA